jgi:hypothetical protein
VITAKDAAGNEASDIIRWTIAPNVAAFEGFLES